MKIMKYLIVAISMFAMNVNALTCDTSSNAKYRTYVSKVTRMQVDDDGYSIFKYKLESGEESGWVYFNSSTEIGKQNMSLMLASGMAGKTFSFYSKEYECYKGTTLGYGFQVEF